MAAYTIHFPWRGKRHEIVVSDNETFTRQRATATIIGWAKMNLFDDIPTVEHLASNWHSIGVTFEQPVDFYESRLNQTERNAIAQAQYNVL
jgi:hypothetical protein